MIKRIAIGLVALAVLAAIGFVAVGGRQGVAVLALKYLLRKDPAPNREVIWQAGPAAPAPIASGQKRPPNIIVIVADDLGYNDLSLAGGGIADGTVPTPHINAIALGGVNFTAGYAGNATCAPSRAAMMTGRYATRFGFEFTPVPVQFSRMVGGHQVDGALRSLIYHADRERDMPPYEDQGLPTSEITIARMLKGAGYRTLQLGKWHLGDSPQFRPYSHGFDESLAMQHAAMMMMDAKDPGVVNAHQPFDPIDKFLYAAHPFGVRFNDSELFAPRGYFTDYMTDEAIKAIKANRNRPFFMYLAYNAPHTPLQATREDYDALPQIADHTTRVYAAMIRSLDRNIGRVMQSLKDQGLDDNTLVVFTSDNGGAHYVGIDRLNSPLRGWKATYFEGGIRVPFFMRWPAAMPAGANYSQPISHFDIFATAAAAAGVALPTDRVIDGVNLAPFVRGESSGAPHERLFWRGGDYAAVREGDWKLQVTATPKRAMLYNLATDPGEKSDLAAAHPERVERLRALIVEFNKSQAKPSWPALIEAPVPVDKTMKVPQAPDDLYVYFSN